MAKNNLTPEQAVRTREFYMQVAQVPGLFPNDPVGQRNMQAAIIRLLGYVVVCGKFVSPEKAKSVKMSFWGKPVTAAELEDEWNSDYQRELDAINNSNSTDQTSARSQTESAAVEVREAVLSEDV
jgi:hypothetical protein